MARLNTTVHVDGQAYRPGVDVPDEVAAKITNPDVWETGHAPAAEHDEDEKPTARKPGRRPAPPKDDAE
jgi:hypothetical protein